jgi:hypothetical protein
MPWYFLKVPQRSIVAPSITSPLYNESESLPLRAERLTALTNSLPVPFQGVLAATVVVATHRC